MKIPPNHPRYDDLAPNYDPVDQLLDRLERVKPARDGWDASCPTPLHEHGDRSRGLHVIRGRDDQAVLYCHAGCSTEEVLEALGLEWKHLFPPRAPGSTPPRSSRRRMPDPLPKEDAALLLEAASRPGFTLDWTVARLLAVRHPITAQRDLLMSWDYLVTLGIDIPFVWATAKMIRGVAFLRYGHAARCNTTDEVHGETTRCVQRLLAEVDRGV